MDPPEIGPSGERTLTLQANRSMRVLSPEGPFSGGSFIRRVLWTYTLSTVYLTVPMDTMPGIRSQILLNHGKIYSLTYPSWYFSCWPVCHHPGGSATKSVIATPALAKLGGNDRKQVTTLRDSRIYLPGHCPSYKLLPYMSPTTTPKTTPW